MFTWKPIYREVAQALMAYRDRQADLLAIVKEMQQADLRVIAMKDRDASGTEIKLAEIDPFTFFTNFNRGTTEDRQRKMVGTLKEKFGLTSPVPDDFHGIPVANLQKAWFFPYAGVRDAGDDRLCRVAAAARRTSRFSGHHDPVPLCRHRSV